VAQRIGLEQAAHLNEKDWGGSATRRRPGRCASGSKISEAFRDGDASSVQAEMRRTRRTDSIFYVTSRTQAGRDPGRDMGLGKTLQTWLAGLVAGTDARTEAFARHLSASVLHNWRREANRFTRI